MASVTVCSDFGAHENKYKKENPKESTVQLLNLVRKFSKVTGVQTCALPISMDGGAWWAAVHGVARSRTRLSNFTFIFTFMHWRRKWRPTPVFLAGGSQGRGSLVGCRLWGSTESDTTEVT